MNVVDLWFWMFAGVAAFAYAPVEPGLAAGHSELPGAIPVIAQPWRRSNNEMGIRPRLFIERRTHHRQEAADLPRRWSRPSWTSCERAALRIVPAHQRRTVDA